MSADELSMSRSMIAAQNGNRSAYTVLLGDCRHWLTGYFRHRIAPQMVDDLIQETLISLHRKRATWDSSRPFLPWLAAIARYRWIDALRKHRETSELNDSEAFVDAHDDEINARLSLGRLLEALPPGQVQAITLVKIGGASVCEASRICGQSESLVKVNIHRGLKKLARLVESK